MLRIKAEGWCLCGSHANTKESLELEFSNIVTNTDNTG